MLALKEGLHSWMRGNWHIGEPMPEIYGAVVTFQADGHELEVLLLGMQQAYLDAHGRVQMQGTNKEYGE